MNGIHVRLEQILSLSREMHRLSQDQNWEALLKADAERAALANSISNNGNITEEDRTRIAEIRSLHHQTVKLVVDEKERIYEEYLQAKNQIEVSSHYLNNTTG